MPKLIQKNQTKYLAGYLTSLNMNNDGYFEELKKTILEAESQGYALTIFKLPTHRTRPLAHTETVLQILDLITENSDKLKQTAVKA